MLLFYAIFAGERDFMRGEILQNLRSSAPRVHCITNYVTANDCANLVLACGASPIMADDPKEVEEIVSACAGLVINLGTPNPRKLEALRLAGRRANERKIPVVLDPVGAGGSVMRLKAAQMLLSEVRLSAIRGNAAEIAALSRDTLNGVGIDAQADDTRENLALAQRLARRTGAIVALSGRRDIVTDGTVAYRVENGHEAMRQVTGAGCMLTCLMGAYFAVNHEEALQAALAAVCTMGVCGERAHARMSKLDGNASYRNYLIDAVCNLTPQELEREARYATYR